MRRPTPSRAALPAALLALTLVGCGDDDDPVRSPATDEGGPVAGTLPGDASEERSRAVAALGRRMYEDTDLSTPPTVSCATCHSPDAGFADPRGGPVSAGAVEGLFGERNAPSVAYAAFVPPLRFATVVEEGGEVEGDYLGGLFLDGRADSLEIQALAPIRNHLEQNEDSDEAIVAALAAADYAPEIERLFGEGTLADTGRALAALAGSIAAFERTAAVSPFSSRFDAHLAGETDALSEEELAGLALFDDPDKGNCSACHTLSPDDPDAPVLFTDHSYDNLGIPRNEANPFLDLPPEANPNGRAHVDLGLLRTTARAEDAGRFRVPTLRNVELTAPYGHNGFFATLEDVVRFYNVKNDGSFGPPEVPETENREEIGALGLSAEEEAAIVAFLKTLTDR